MSGSNLLFILSGSIACYKACEAVSRLVTAGHSVRIAATPAAMRFVGMSTLEGLTGAPVATDLWEKDRAMDHIKLDRWADLVIVCPATAGTLNRLAAGLADDLVGALFLAHDRHKPWLVAPAMNPAMWSHPATVAAVEKLRGWGVSCLPVGDGRVACGESGGGRMAEPADVVWAVETALARPTRRRRVLITSGATAEPIDAVRVLTNPSTGRTGAALARHFARAGHAVTLLRATGAEPAGGPLPEVIFHSFADLDAALVRLLGGGGFDTVIHAAAVGDFGIGAVRLAEGGRPAGSKFDSQRPLQIDLVPQPKLLTGLRAHSPVPLTVVAFKLTAGATTAEAHAAVAALFAGAAPDFIVHNDLAARTEDGGFPATIHLPGGAPPLRCTDRPEIAVALERLLALSVVPV